MQIRKVSADRLDGPSSTRRGSASSGASTTRQTDEAADFDIRDDDADDAADEHTDEALRPTGAI